MFAGIVLPILTALWAKQEKDKFSNTLQKSFNVLALLAIPLAIGTQFVANDVMTLVAGREFILSGAVLKLLIIAASLIYLGNIFSHAVIAIDKQKQIIGAYIFTAITAVAGYFIFIPRFSYFGAAWVTIYSELIIALAAVYIVWKYTHFLPSLAILFKSLAASLVMILPLYYLKNYNLIFVVLPSAVATYLLALYAFGGIAKNELKELFIK
jgi:O-antigen/teichoic acid export membrane protein